MRRRHLGGLAVAALVGATLAVLPHGADAAAPTQGHSAKALATQSARNLIASKMPALKISNHDGFRAAPVISSHGIQYAPYERTYKGLPVVGGDFVVVTDSRGQVITTSVAQTHQVALKSLTPSVSKASAVHTARQQVPHVTKSTPAHRVVFQRGASSRLGWQTTVTGHHGVMPSIKTVVVDARNGKVLQAKEHVADGTGTAAYDGPNPVTIPTTHSGTTFSMIDPNHTTIRCQNATGNVTFTGTDDVWGNGSKTDRETGCVDAMFVENVENNMLATWDGRNSFDGAGGGWPIRIGLNDENAFYDGTQVQIGHNTQGQWIPVLDVLGHEQGHGVDDHTPGGISGAGTQEFVADTFGAATEWFANEPAAFDPPDFTVGEEVNLVGTGPIRTMYNPSVNGDSNCYSSSIPQQEVHAAAGPGNHWFYLLAEGTNPTNGQPTSPTCNGTTVTGVGIQNAEKIMYNAMLMKTTTSSYLKYRTWTLTSAKNLDPSCGLYNTTKAAWNAVSVPAQAADPTCTTGGNTVTVNNPGAQSGTVGTAKSLQMTATDSQAGQTFTWSATGLPTGLSINASTGLISGTPTTAGTFSSTVTARDTTGATGSTTVSWTISPVGGGCSSPGQKLGNPGFETGTAAPWSATAGVIDNTAGQPAHSGAWKAWLDGYGTTHTDTLSQSVTIPAGCAATLTFFLHIDSAETTTTTQFDKLTVKAGTTTLATFSNLNKAAGYTQRSFNLSSFAGQTVSISFTGTEDVSLQTSFVVDDTALTVS